MADSAAGRQPGEAPTPLAELARRATHRPAVILDDDPTGTQTVRDLPVLTEWDAARIARHLAAGEPAIFLSTNARALEEADAVAVTADAARAAHDAADRVDTPISIISRSDSTLRGHFPADTLAIAEAIGRPDARVLLAPFFAEGGRLTRDDVHLLERNGVRTPVAETEFAADAAFGYRSSNLREWVAEKHVTAGRPVPPTVSLSV
ncbi:MAG TPA: four-carbon acid sugar kinase family protein, partial [Candidatus Limnocylindrales bacterium]|nr:four-carbon acid sugar kinase family protein [Candidatus Limnocylindrales bacterium]